MNDATTSISVIASISFALGCLAGGMGLRWGVRLTPEIPQQATTSQTVWIGVFSGLLFAAFSIGYLVWDCQADPMVRPDPVWRVGRIFFHQALLLLLITATVTDLRDYVIPDQITVPGTICGVLAATLAGDLQMMHLWIDWNQEIPTFQGAYIPEWIKEHHHWHGLAWSVAGLVVGAGLTWTVRFLSSLILGRQALGFGDVTLMAMIGSFLGWQPTVCVFLLAPFCGILLAFITWAFTGRGFVPYGPYLAMAAVIVMFSWNWIWTPLKWTFGDATTLGILGVVSVSALVVLLGILRFYWSIPVEAHRKHQSNEDNAASV